MTGTHVLTGAGSGIGLALARRLVERGDRLVLLARSDARAAELSRTFPDAQLLVAEVAGRFLAAGQAPPVFRSANTPGGDAYNDRLLEEYGSRVRLGDA